MGPRACLKCSGSALAAGTVARLALAGLLLVIAAGCGEQRQVGLTKAVPSGTPVLIITIDTLRTDALGFIGGHDNSPHIDAIAQQGFRFHRAVSTVPLTLPAHTSLLSGNTPHNHGVHDNGHQVPLSMPMLQERLRDAGYSTGAFVSAFVLDASFGLDRGFDNYDDHLPSGSEGWLERHANDTADAALEWIGKQDDAWFAWVHFYDPHSPYSPPEDFRRPGPLGHYAGEVAHVDAQIGRIVEAVRARGVEPLIIITADHGEAFGEHGEQIHGLFIYDTTMAIPLVFSYPSVIAAGESKAAPRIHDIPETVLGLLGLESLGHVDGVDISPLLRGEDVAIPPAYLETQQPWITYGWAPLQGVSHGQWKFIQAPVPELYDLADDPGELNNLFDAAHPKAQQMIAELDALTVNEPRYSASSSMDPEQIAKLQSLGYVGSGGSRDGDFSKAPDPKSMLAQRDLLLRAEMRLRADRFDLAREIFGQVLAEDPDNRFANLRMGVGLLKLGELESAVPYLQHSVTLDPRQAESRFALADVLTRLRRFDEAIPHWQECIALQPRRLGAWANLGSTLLWSGKNAEAVIALRQAVTLSPESAGLRSNLGVALLLAGERSEAVETLLAASRADPEAFAEGGRLAMLLLQDGRLQEAKPLLLRIPQDAQGFAASRFHLARIDASAGREDEAREHLMMAIERDPKVREMASNDPLLKPLLERAD